MAKSTRATSASDNCSVASPWEELKSLKSALADLQAKRLSALRLYQEEKVLRQQEAERVAQLAAKIQALDTSESGKHSVRKTDSSPNFSSRSGSSLQEQEISSKNGYCNRNEIETSINRDDSASAQRKSQVTIEGRIAEISVVARLPAGLPTSLTWHSLSLTNILPPPPDIIAFLSPLSASDTDDACSKGVSQDSARSHAFQKASVSTGPNRHDSSLSPQNSEIQHLGTDSNNGNVTLEQNSNNTIGDLEELENGKERAAVSVPPIAPRVGFESDEYSNGVLGDGTILSDNAPHRVKIESKMCETPCPSTCGVAALCKGGNLESNIKSDANSLASALAELAKLRQRLRTAEDEAARACHELKQSTQLIADMKQQLDASTSACKEMVDTIMEQEKTITQLSEQQQRNTP